MDKAKRIASKTLLVISLLLLSYSITYCLAPNVSQNTVKPTPTPTIKVNVTPTPITIKVNVTLKKCEDGTLSGSCSAKKPLFCENGTLVPKASICGCPEKYVQEGDSCIFGLTLHPVEKEFRYCYFGFEGSILITLFRGMNDYLAEEAKKVACEENYYLKMIEQPDQREAIKELIQKIEKITDLKDDQARIAISLTQINQCFSL